MSDDDQKMDVVVECCATNKTKSEINNHDKQGNPNSNSNLNSDRNSITPKQNGTNASARTSNSRSKLKLRAEQKIERAKKQAEEIVRKECCFFLSWFFICMCHLGF